MIWTHSRMSISEYLFILCLMPLGLFAQLGKCSFLSMHVLPIKTNSAAEKLIAATSEETLLEMSDHIEPLQCCGTWPITQGMPYGVLFCRLLLFSFQCKASSLAFANSIPLMTETPVDGERLSFAFKESLLIFLCAILDTQMWLVVFFF